MIINKLLKCFLLLILSTNLYGCHKEDKGCIAPDNFGDKIDITIDPRIHYFHESQTGFMKSTKWVYSGYDAGNGPLVVQKITDMKNNSTQGLYLLLTAKDPNINLLTINNPKKIDAGAIIKRFSPEKNSTVTVDPNVDGLSAGKKIYFMVLDNSEKVSEDMTPIVVRVLRGTSNESRDPMSNVIRKVEKYTRTIVKNIYKAITKDGSYTRIVSFMLTIFMIFYSLAFVMGFIRGTVGDLITLLLKTGLVSVIISPAGFQFFNEYIFEFFYEGTMEIASITSGNTAMLGKEGSSASLFIDMITTIVNKETFDKLVGLVFARFWMGVLLFIIYFVCIIFIALGVLYSAILYILSLMTLGLVLSLTPIFIPMILFKLLEQNFFNQWIKIAVASMLQVAIVVGFYSFFSSIIQHHMHRNLGYRVCWTEIIDLGLFSIYNWKVNISDEKANILVPSAFRNSSGKFCQPYECVENRYVHLPYLRPRGSGMGSPGANNQYGSNADMISQLLFEDDDQELIDNFMQRHAPRAKDAGYFLIIVLLFFVATMTITEMAKQLSDRAWSEGGESQAIDFAGMPQNVATGMLESQIIHPLSSKISEKAVANPLSRKISSKMGESYYNRKKKPPIPDPNDPKNPPSNDESQKDTKASRGNEQSNIDNEERDMNRDGPRVENEEQPRADNAEPRENRDNERSGNLE